MEIKKYVVVVPVAIYARDRTDWDDPSGTGFSCFQDLNASGWRAEAERLGESEADGFQAWLLPLHVPGDLPDRLSLEELKEQITSQCPWPGLHLGDRFFESIPVLAPEFLISAYERISTAEIPAEYVVAAMQSMKRLDEPGFGFFKPTEEPIRFFEGFATFVEILSVEEVDEVVWKYLSHPGWISDAGPRDETSDEYGPRFIKSMIYPFRDYLVKLSDEEASRQNGFYMWWDFFDMCPYVATHVDVTVAVLAEILELPSNACQAAALHGLNHLAPTGDRERTIDSWLARKTRSDDLISYAQNCRSGIAL